MTRTQSAIPQNSHRFALAVGLLSILLLWPALASAQAMPFHFRPAPGEVVQFLEPRPQGGYVAVLGSSGSGPIGAVISPSFPQWIETDSFYSSTSASFLPSTERTKAILRLDSAGNVLSRIEIGGTNYSVSASGLVQLRDGSVVVAGTTNSPEFAVVRPLFPGIAIPVTEEPLTESWGFVLKTDPALRRIETATLIGGQAEGVLGGTRILDLARDTQANIYLTGSTTHRSFPVIDGAWKRTSGIQEQVGNSPRTRSEGFLMKLSPDLGSLLASTFLGAEALNCAPGWDFFCSSVGVNNTGLRLAIQRQGNPVVLFSTTGTDFPVTAGAFDRPAIEETVGWGVQQRLYLATLSSDLSRLIASSHIGGTVPGFSSASGGERLELLPDGSLLTLHSHVTMPVIGPASVYQTDILSLWNQAGTALLDELRFEAIGGRVDSSRINLFDVKFGPDGSIWVAGTATREKREILGLSPTVDVPTPSNDFLLKLRGPGLTPAHLDRLPMGTVAGIASISPAGVDVLDRFGRVRQYPLGGIPSPAIFAIADLADGYSTAASRIAPMQLLRLMGTGLGPTSTVQAAFDRNGFLPTILEGLQITVDGVPSPLLAVGPHFVDFVVPQAAAKALAGGRGQVLVKLSSAGGMELEYAQDIVPFWLRPFEYPQSNDDPGSLYFSSKVLNANGTVNGPSSPAMPGEALTVYLNGAGVPSTLLPDGKRMDAALPWFSVQPRLMVNQPYPGPTGPPPFPGEVLYFGAAPGLVSGTIQMNFSIPPEALKFHVFSPEDSDSQMANATIELSVPGEDGERAFQPAASLAVWVHIERPPGI